MKANAKNRLVVVSDGAKVINDSTVEYAQVKDLLIDHSYQRDLDVARAEAIGKNLDRRLLGSFIVSRRDDGRLYIIDAQHRHHGLMHVGLAHELVRCEVISGLTVEDEAFLYRLLNKNRKAVDALGDYRAALRHLDPSALEIDAIVRKLDLRISSRGSAKRTISAIEAVKVVHNKQNLERTLTILSAWDEGPAVYQATLLRGLSSFLAYYTKRDDSPGVDDAHLISVLVKQSPESIIAKIKRLSVQFSTAEAACAVFSELYNYKRRNRLPPFVGA